VNEAQVVRARQKIDGDVVGGYSVVLANALLTTVVDGWR
jgi:hypothetical protein